MYYYVLANDSSIFPDHCRRDFRKCILVRKCINGLASRYLLSGLHNIRNIEVRTRDLLRLPLAKTKNFRAFFNTVGEHLEHASKVCKIHYQILSISNCPRQFPMNFFFSFNVVCNV